MRKWNSSSIHLIHNQPNLCSELFLVITLPFRLRSQYYFVKTYYFLKMKKLLKITVFSSPGLKPGELLSSLFVRRLSSVVRPSVNISHFNLLLRNHWANCNQIWWNGPWMAPFQNCVRWSRLPAKMAAKLKIEKRGDEILIVHCCFSVSQNELKF